MKFRNSKQCDWLELKGSEDLLELSWFGLELRTPVWLVNIIEASMLSLLVSSMTDLPWWLRASTFKASKLDAACMYRKASSKTLLNALHGQDFDIADMVRLPWDTL